MNIGFIGFGNMARAMADGLILKGLDHQILATSPSLTEESVPTEVKVIRDNIDIASMSDVLILAVKPSKIAEVLSEINTVIKNDCIIISVAASLNIDYYEKRLPPKQPMVRAMPNTPVAVGEGVILLQEGHYIDEHQKQRVVDVLSLLGSCRWIFSDKQMDALTVLSGCGPAYVYLMMQGIIEGAVELGIELNDAIALTLQTFKGAVTMAQTEDASVAELRSRVAPAGGVTAEAIAVFEQEKLRELIAKAMKKAFDHTQKI